MENCWFKLKQHYPPPEHLKILNGCAGQGDGLICLGFVITDLKRLDQPLNPYSIQPFPRGPQGMIASHIRVDDLKWNGARSKHGAAGGRISATAAPGTTVEGRLQAEFQNSVTGHEEYDRVDKYIINPTKHYVAATCAKEEDVARKLGLLCKSLYMITGLCVARKGKFTTSESHGMAVDGGVRVDVSGAGGASANAAFGHSSSTSMEGAHEGAIVWAVRLTKFRRNSPSSAWQIDTLTKGAVFNHHEAEEVDVAKMLKEDGFDAHVVEDRELNCAIVSILG